MADSINLEKRMRYDDDRYLDDEADNDLWDDELELRSDDTEPAAGRHGRGYASESSFSPYQADEERDKSLFDNREKEEDSDDDDDEEEEEEEDEDDVEDTEEEADYYDSTPRQTRPKQPKTPKLDPEDPDYWISEEESPLSGIMHPPGKKWKWKLAALGGVLILLLWGWIWFMLPHTDNAVKYGYLKNMERRGTLIKTFEGSMIPYKEIGDPNPLYFQELRFSVESDSLAARMKRMMLNCVPVRVEYEIYHAPLPWKGEETMIITSVDSADPRKILPPEFRYNYK